MKRFQITQRQACRTLNVHRNSIRYQPVVRDDEEELVKEIIELATNFGRKGYRMVTDILRNRGYKISYKKVARIWQREGLKRPKKQTKKRRIFGSDGNCVRLRAMHKNHGFKKQTLLFTLEISKPILTMIILQLLI
ncbi:MULTISPECIES: IS3 family transposase [Anaerotignum]|uniref:IS3 family transposase n=1 Tax=Anaerotignum TaxID=2039240 RepID=UPI00082662AE|nr:MULTISPECIES: IS3 family transposase [Anaerotignum]